VVKALFYNIGVVVKKLWDNIIKPYIMIWVDAFVWLYKSIWSVLKWLWQKIVDASEFIALAFNKVVSFVAKAFKWLWQTFFVKPLLWVFNKLGSFGNWIKEKVYQPFVDAFSSAWDFVSNILNKIMNKLSGLLSPIKKLWNKIFPKDQFKDLGDAAKRGAEKGSESWEKSQNKNKQGFSLPGKNASGGMFGGAMATGAGFNERISSDAGGNAATEAVVAGGTRNTSVNISLGNMVENMIFEGGFEENKEDLQRKVEEIFMRIVNMAAAVG
jgi:hypothetical protein